MTYSLKPRKFPLPLNAGTVKTDWAARGYSCDPFTDPPGRRWEDYIHTCNELVTVIEGKLEMEIGGEAVIVSPGDEVFIPARAKHSVRNVNEGTTRWLYGYD
jgi:mannose-6-phosphate isomerase-like protein (cupin superfamily)